MDAGVLLEEVLGRELGPPVWGWSNEKLLACLDGVQALMQSLEAARLRLVREFDGRDLGRAAGATTTVAWLREHWRISPGTASTLVALAKVTDEGRELAATGAALAEGTLNLEQVKTIRSAVADLPKPHRADGEQLMLAEAALSGPGPLSQFGRTLLGRLDPEEADRRLAEKVRRDEDRQHPRRFFNLSDQHGTGMVRLSGLLDTEGAAVLRAAIEPLCAPRTRRDPDGEPRTPAQCRADALVEIGRLALATGDLPEHGGDRPQIVVTVDWESLRQQVGLATFDDGAMVSPAEARRIACDAAILPTVLGGPGQVLDVGRERRLVTGALRRALVLRDGGCAFPSCDRPPKWTAGHHITHWADGGSTSLTNTVLLCGHHHGLVHRGDWQVRLNPTDARPEFVPPSYVDPKRTAIRNRHHPRR